MKKKRMILGFLCLAFIILGNLKAYSVYGGDAISEGMALPAVEMSMPESAEFKQYLGLEDLKSFSLSKIQCKLIFIEAFSTFCPICHKNAPLLNNLYQIIEGDPELSKDIKVIGVAAGNKYFQIDAYRDQFKVAFPIIEDPYLKFHKGIGSPGVPFMILASNDGKVLKTHIGLIEDVDAILEEMRELIKK